VQYGNRTECAGKGEKKKERAKEEKGEVKCSHVKERESN
jgi:hypothetical protein